MAEEKPLQVITLNSITYLVREVEEQAAPNWGPVVAQVGGQTREARTGTPQWDMTPHIGLGQELIRNLSESNGSFVDSTAETRWSDFVTLPGLWVAEASWTPTHKITPDPTDTDLDLKGLINFDDEIWLFEGTTGVGTSCYLYARRFDETGTPAWDVTETAATVGGNDTFRVSPLAACVVGGYMFCYYQMRNETASTVSYGAVKRDLGGNWTSATMTGFTNQNYCLLCSNGNRLYAATWDAKTVRLYYSDDYGANWTAGATSIESNYQPTAFVLAINTFDNTGAYVPYLCTAEALWEVSATAATPIKVLDFSITGISKWNGVGMGVWERTNYLYVPMGNPPLGQLLMLQFSGGTVEVNPDVGLDYTAWPTARQGRIVGLVSTPRWLFALVRNTGNSECSIFAGDGVGWHHIYDSNQAADSGGWPTTGTIKPQGFGISNVDGTQRLHLVWDNGTTADACHLKNPLQRPLDVSGFVYATTAYVLYARFGGDALIDTKGFYTFWLVGDSLTADEKATMSYGLDGAAPSVDLTAHTASGQQRMGTNGIGVSGTTIQPKMTLTRGATTTDKPVIRGLSLEYAVVPTARLRFILKGIDLDASYERQGQYPMTQTTKVDRETMITNLETVRDSAVMVPLVYPYGATSKNVKALPETFQGVYTISKETEDQATQQRTGFVNLVLEEV